MIGDPVSEVPFQINIFEPINVSLKQDIQSGSRSVPEVVFLSLVAKLW